MHSFDRTYHQLLVEGVENLSDEKQGEFAAGGWAGGLPDASTIGAKAQWYIGYLRALEHVLKLCDSIKSELDR